MTEKTSNAFRVGVLCAALTAVSATAVAESLAIRNAWARPTVAGQPVGAAYLEITSSADTTVVELRSEVASFVELHTMQHQGDVMRMRQVAQLPLPAGRTVKLVPGGTHVMLLGLTRPLRAGESVGLDLMLADSSGRRRTVHVNVPVQAGAPGEGGR